MNSSSAAAGDVHSNRSDSPGIWRVRCVAGIAATKNQVSYRRGSTSGVIQRAHGRIRSTRTPRPRRASTAARLVVLLSRATRSASQLGSLTSADVPPSGPASRTPLSSNVSRTAAQTSARASAGSAPGGNVASAAPNRSSSASPSAWSTVPPGKTYMPAAKAIVDTLRSRQISTPEAPGPPRAGRRSTTVAAARAGAGVSRPGR